MNKTTNKFSPEVRERAVRLVLDNRGQHGPAPPLMPGSFWMPSSMPSMNAGRSRGMGLVHHSDHGSQYL